MTLTPDEIRNAGPLGNAWVALRAAEGDLHKFVPTCSDEMHLLACLWSHLEDIDVAIEVAVRGGDRDHVGDGGGDAEGRADTPRGVENWLTDHVIVSDEDYAAIDEGYDASCDDDDEADDLADVDMDDEGD